MGEWKRADLNRGPRGSSVALGGARSPLGELGHSWGSSGGAQSPSTERPPGEHGHPRGSSVALPCVDSWPRVAAQRLSLPFITKLYLLSVAPQRSFTRLWAQDNARTMPAKAKNKSPDAKSLDGNFTGNFTEEDRLQRLEHGLDEIENRLQSSFSSFTEQLLDQLRQGGAMSRGDRTPTPVSGGAGLGDTAGTATPRANLRSVFAQTGTALPASTTRPSGSGVASRTSTTAMLSQWMQDNRRVYDAGPHGGLLKNY